MFPVARRIGLALLPLLVCLGCEKAPTQTTRPGDATTTRSTADATAPLERWYALSFSGQNVGDVHTKEWRDSEGLLHVADDSSFSITRVNGDSEDKFESRTKSHTVYDRQNNVTWEEETVWEGGVETATRLEIVGQELVMTYKGPDRSETNRYALPKDFRSSRAVIVELIERYGRSKQPEKQTFSGFNDDSRTFERHEVTLHGPASHVHGGKEVAGWRFEIHSEDGAVVHSTVDHELMAMEIEYQGSFRARWVDGKPRPSSGTITSEIEVVGSAAREWWRLRSLQLDVTVSGDDTKKPAIFEDGPYHTVEREGEHYRVVLRSTKLPADHLAPKLPITPPKDISRYLGATAQAQSDDPKLVELARRIAGPADDSLVVAQRITSWVFENLEKKSGVRGSATATEVLASGQGDCTEHASLVVALLRAAGLPARSADGIVFGTTADGSVIAGYHAWAEVWVGRWIGVDATVGELGTSARYLHFGYTEPGEKSTATALIRTVGRTRIEVQGFDLF